MERLAARRIIDQIRSGVSSKEAAAALPFGRESILEEIRSDLGKIASDGRPSHPYRVFLADYGVGKTHMLQSVWSLAEQAGFVVSHITISREAPLGRPDRVYRKLMARTFLPGRHEAGIGPLLDDLARRPEETGELLRFSERELHPRLALVLEARLRAAGGRDDEVLDQDLAGYFPPLPELRLAYRERFGTAPKVERFRLADHAFDYFRLLDRLVASGGCAGWVLLFDEFEMVGRLGRRARAASYEFFRRVALDRELPHAMSFWGVAASFKTETLEKRSEAESLGVWLEARGEKDEARQVRGVLELLSAQPALPPLKEAQIAETFAAIGRLHGLAYGWQPPETDLYREVRALVPERDVKMRQLVRAAVQILDLRLVHGEAADLLVEEVQEAPLTPLDEEEPPEGEGVGRAWPDD